MIVALSKLDQYQAECEMPFRGSNQSREINHGWTRIDTDAEKEKIRANPCNPWLKNPWLILNHHWEGEMVWALRDVSFTVEQGEVLGVALCLTLLQRHRLSA
jgi:hypothetical protein